MELKLVEKRRPPGQKCYSWLAYEFDERFNPSWWNSHDMFCDHYRYLEAELDGVPVVRAKLDEEVDFSHYNGAPALGARALEIQFIEVAETHRLQRIGTEFIKRLIQANGNRVLVAFSEDADGFWASLGWKRFDHPEGWPSYRPLFVQPF